MRYPDSLLFFLVSSLFTLQNSHAQSCGDLQFTLKSEIPSGCADVTMTMREDALARPYLYVAVKDSGMRVYDVANISMPKLVASLTDDRFGGLHVMNITQEKSCLYLALGNSFTTVSWQNPGMAIVDVSDPTKPVVTDVY